MNTVADPPAATRRCTISEPLIIQRSEHIVSRANISENSLKVLYRLRSAGYQGYLVGGGVRDLLLGREPKDFDIATDAKPEQIRQLFRNCRLIGRRFRLAHVRFRDEIIEVATFRGLHDPSDEADEDGAERETDNGRILRDNVFGTVEEDAWRRDFTVNALFYSVEDFSVLDYVGGMADLRDGVLRLIGDAEQRYREDPVRMLRAARFAAKLGFRIHPDTETPLARLAPLLLDIPPARLFEEVLKLFLGGYAVQTFELLRHYGLFEPLFAQTERSLAHEEKGFPITFVARALENTDKRIAEGKPVTPAFLFAALLWEPVRERAAQLLGEDTSELAAIQQAADEVLAQQTQRVAIPRRFSVPMREIWQLQSRLARPGGRRVWAIASHPRFRAGYDFFLLRAESGEIDLALAEWWTRFQEVDHADQQAMVDQQGDSRRKPRRRRRRRKSSGTPSEEA